MATSKANNDNNNINKPSTKLGFDLKSNNSDNETTHYSNGVRTTLNTSAYKKNKFDWFNFKYEDGYPFSDFYGFCKQRLSIIYQYGSSFTSKSTSENNHYPQLNIRNSVVNNATNNDGCEFPYGPDPNPGCINTTPCTPPSVFDPTSCKCTTPTTCIPDPPVGCPSIEIPTGLKNIIKGYACYVDAPRDINIPDIGTIKTTCGGGHSCNGTLFKPKLVSSSTTVVANKTICMNNANSSSIVNGNINIPNFVDQTGGERSDTFEFVLDDTAILAENPKVILECQYSRCHNGVTMVYLVGYTELTNTPVLLFASCVTPGATNGKFIGTIDCGTGETIPCNPPPPPGPPGPPVPPPNCAPISSALNITISYPDFDFDQTVGNLVNWPPYTENLAPQCQATYETEPGFYDWIVTQMQTPLTHNLSAGSSQIVVPATYGATAFAIVDTITWFVETGILYVSRSIILLNTTQIPIYNQVVLSASATVNVDSTACSFNLNVSSITSYNSPNPCYIGTQVVITTTS